MNDAHRIQMISDAQRQVDEPRQAATCSGLSRRDWLAAVALLGLAHTPAALAQASPQRPVVPILTYHRFASNIQDSMTVRTATFTSHLTVFQDLGCEVMPLRALVDYRRGRRRTLPQRAVVITADEGHSSQFEIMVPMLADLNLPATFFIDPSAISNAAHAMTWPQLQALAVRSQWEFGSLMQWHPHFERERQRMSRQDFLRLIDQQLMHAKEVLVQRLARPIDWLAWPFGLEDALVRQRAQACGYEAAMTLGNRPDTDNDLVFAMPRYLVTDAMNADSLRKHLLQAFGLNSE